LRTVWEVGAIAVVLMIVLLPTSYLSTIIRDVTGTDLGCDVKSAVSNQYSAFRDQRLGFDPQLLVKPLIRMTPSHVLGIWSLLGI
jgi:hypothetical protein